MSQAPVSDRNDKRPSSPASRTPWVSALGLLHLVVGGLALLAVVLLANRWHGFGKPSGAVAELVHHNAIVGHWLVGSLMALAGAGALLFAAGVGLLRMRRWGFKIAFYYAVGGLGLALLGSIVIFSHFGKALRKDPGATKAAFTVTLTHATTSAVHVAFATADDTALAGTDYVATNGVLTIPPGETSQSITTWVLRDSIAEDRVETYHLRLADAVGATLSRVVGVATNIDDDATPVLYLKDAQIRERESGTFEAVFAASLSRECNSNVTVAFETADGTALSGEDYLPTRGTLTIPAWRTNGSVRVHIQGDRVDEGGPETFTINLAGPQHATLARTQATGTIAEDDGPPSLSISVNGPVSEGNTDSRKATFGLYLTHACASNVTVQFQTRDGTAMAGSDYVAVDRTVIIPAWRTNILVKVEVSGDQDAEAIEEYFTVQLSDAVNARLTGAEAIATIRDNDGTPELTIADLSVDELNRSSSRALVNVHLSLPFREPVTVAYATADGTGTAGSDYKPSKGELVIPKGQTSGTIGISILGDVQVEGAAETFTVGLSQATHAEIRDAEAVVSIVDDDAMPYMSVGDVQVVEGNRADAPGAVALATLIRGGFWAALLMLLVCPVVALVMISREGVLAPFGFSLTDTTYTAGTITYTKVGLIALFAWLLWGDFVWTLMEAVVPQILPLKLESLGASSTLISVIMTTLPAILNMTICPWVSFKSDRHRGRFGRRIPFIVWTMPFLTLSLIILGWSGDISIWLRQTIPAVQAMAPNTLIILLIAVFLVLFQFFNMFVNSVFWYLFNDVVPAQFLGRFMGLFRIVGVAAGAIFNGFIFPHAETHMREILTGGALLYFIGFGLMCLRVKEGAYPPITGEAGRPKGLMSEFKIYGEESFSVRFYWYFFLAGAFSRIAYALGIFGVFFNKEMGLTLAHIGKLSMYGSIAGLLATYFAATLVDRWHPMRIVTYEKVFTAVTGFGGWIWLLMTLPGDMYFWISLAGTLVTTFNFVLGDAAGIPLLMRVLPKSRYGQFSSAAALIRSAAVILAGVIAGLFMDFLKWTCDGSNFAYRLIFLWVWPFNLIVLTFTLLAYRDWKRLGGDTHYRPPAPWSPTGYEETIDKVKSVPSKPRATIFALYLGVAGSVLNLLLVLVFMHYMYRHGMIWALRWNAFWFIPLKLLLTLVMFWQVQLVKRDIVRQERGEPLHYGVPHHGVFLVLNITNLFYLPVYWLQTVWMIHLGMEHELIVVGMNALLQTLAVIAAVHIIRWAERAGTAVAHEKAPDAARPAVA